MSTIITHVITKPPVTDDDALLGLYRQLFDALQIKHMLDFYKPVGEYHHPIPESQSTILKDFNHTFYLLRNAQQELNTVLEVSNVRVSASSITFVIRKRIIS